MTTLVNKKDELQNCNFIKTVLMLIIVFYHSIVFWTEHWFSQPPVHQSTVLSVLANWLNTFHIYGFTLISGYIFFFLKCEQGKYQKFSTFICNKAKRLLIPAVFVGTIWAIPFSIVFFRYSTLDIIKKYILAISPDQLWFCWMLFGVFLMFWPLSNFMKKHSFFSLVVVLAFWGIGSLGLLLKPIPNVYQIYMVCRYMPFFWMGFKMRQYNSDILRKIPTVMWLLTDIVLYALYLYLSTFSGMFFRLVQEILGFVLHMVGAMMAFLVLQKLADRISWKKSKIFTFLTKHSMPIYLLHQQVVYLFIYWLNGALNPYAHGFLNFVGTMAVSLIISTGLMKFKWTRFMLGEK